MAKRIAIVTDSNSGITQQQAKELGVYVLPMPFIIDGQTHYEDVDLSQPEFYQLLLNDHDISTSQPIVGEVLSLWDSLLEEYDEIVHIPMSSGLSSSCSTATALAEDYDGRIQVVNNQRISVTQRQSVMDALEMVKAGLSAAQIRTALEREGLEASIYIMLETLKYLKKGGRVTPAAAAVATVLHIHPVLQIQGEKLDAYAKARGEKQGRSIMIDAIRKDIETRFGGVENVDIFVAHTNQDAAAQEYAQRVSQELGAPVRFCDPLSLSVSCHIGNGALAVACAKKIDFTPELAEAK